MTAPVLTLAEAADRLRHLLEIYDTTYVDGWMPVNASYFPAIEFAAAFLSVFAEALEDSDALT